MTFRKAVEVLWERAETWAPGPRAMSGLKGLRACLAKLGNPHLKVPAIHVAGTNGKGSTCAIIDSALRAAGWRTGLYTSPHLTCVRERIRVGGRPIPEAVFGRLLGRVLKTDPKSELHFFELLTAVGFLHFAESRVEVIVLEAGLGGRLDATNVVEDPLVSVITSIGKDHVEYLGSSLPSIAAEKAGIIKQGRPVVCPVLADSAMRPIRRAAGERGAPLVAVEAFPKVERVDWRNGSQVLRPAQGGPWKLRLLGSRQPRNVALARAALARIEGRFQVPERAWERGLSTVRWPCRFDVRRSAGKTVIIDGAHNVEAMEHFAATFRASPWSSGSVRFIIGMLRDKDVAGMLRVLSPWLREASACRPESPRAMDPVDLARSVRACVPGARVSVEHTVSAALRSWRSRRSAGTAVVCGSFYLAGEAAAALRHG
ncbi:MAG: bifunctional folylpolyglutamate synthase/dihydrofolate synthase [Elusimicrobia bacterium]|nr:bifunctional folylpolyglutamate synthase/dihydrofolate synthase [Elusimicrobiota bacterium]